MKDESFTIEKTTVECYKLRNRSTWADITIDAKEETGRIQIASDYGHWQFYWGSCGLPFKKFLISLDRHYVAGKFGAGKWFDPVKTIAEYKEVVKANIDDGYLNKLDGEEAIGEIDQLLDYTDRSEFCRVLEDCSQIMKIYDHCPALIYGIDPQFENFWSKIWPVFVDQIKKECITNNQKS